jgi:prophage regulatory protein
LPSLENHHLNAIKLIEDEVIQMKTSLFTPHSSDELKDPIIKEKQREFLTSVSRSQAFKLERLGLFPQHIELSANTVGWKLSEVLAWIRYRPVVQFDLEGEC